MRGSRDSSSDTTEPAPPPQDGPSSIHEEGWAGEAAAEAATAIDSVLPQEVAENPAPDSSSNSAAPGRNDAAEPPPTPQPTTGHDESDSTPAPSLLPLPSMGCTPDSDLARVDRLIWVVTTAAMPWRTGTAVNPLLRALYLARNRPPNAVTLLVPWLCPKEEREAQQQLYGQVFDEPSQQEDWIRDYCRTRCHCPDEERLLRIRFWKGSYQEAFGSIFPTEDICALIPSDEADVAILEEPEHLNWFRVPKLRAILTDPVPVPNPDDPPTGDNGSDNKNANANAPPNSKDKPKAKTLQQKEALGWKFKFRHVVGVLHTNYAAYVRQYGLGTSLLTAPALNGLSSLVVRAYCHRIIRLSAALPSLDAPKEITSNIHGVRSEFLPTHRDALQTADDVAIGTKSGSRNADATAASPVYFIGKLIWAKGFDKVLELQQCFRNATGTYFAVDVYGSGNDEAAIRRAFFGRHHHQKPHAKQPQHAKTPAPSQSGSSDDQDHHSSSSSTPSEDKRAKLVFSQRHSLRAQLTEAVADDNSRSATTPSSAAMPSGGQGGDATPRHDPPPASNHSNASADTTEDTAAAAAAVGATAMDTRGSDVPPSSHPLGILGDLSGKTVTTGMETAEAGLQLIENALQCVFLGRNKDVDYDRLDSDVSNSSNASSDSEKEPSDDNDEGVLNGVVEKESPDSMTTSPDAVELSAVDPASKSSSASDATSHLLSKARKLRANPFGLVPPRARFKWRRTPLPARFLGVQDHIVVRDIPQQSIFLNMSTTEVLCTTSAEALAMGKFVIIPQHPSNEFFYQFPNCLAYQDMDDCVVKLQYALANTPQPLKEEHAHVLSWEGATERLYEASRITVAEDEKYRTQFAAADEKAARLHVEGAQHSHKLRSWIHDTLLI